MDLTAQVARHADAGATATLALVPVEDTSSYGVVPIAADGRVEAFLEKTDAPPTNLINAGAYVLERSVAESIPAGRPVSFEREVFPELIGAGLHGFAHDDAYWIDIGTPERYLEATYDLLSGSVESTLPARDETGSLVYEGSITGGAHIGPQTVIGPHCMVGSDATIERSVLHEGVVAGADAVVRASVLAADVRLGAGATVGPGAVVGAEAVVGEGAIVDEGARIEPGAAVEAGERVP
jgi:mannose-1-phosphate guanylyltransferase